MNALKWHAMTSQMRGKWKERHRKVPARLLDQLSILFCLGIMSMPCFCFLSHRFAGFLILLYTYDIERSNSGFQIIVAGLC